MAQPVFAASVQQTRAARRVHAVLLVTVAMLSFPAAVWSQDGNAKSRHAEIVPEHGGELLMALGDALRVRAHSYTCYYDVCTIEAGAGRALWTTNRRELVVSNGGVVQAARVGSFGLSVRFRGFSANRTVRVHPPVKDLTWSRPIGRTRFEFGRSRGTDAAASPTCRSTKGRDLISTIAREGALPQCERNV